MENLKKQKHRESKLALRPILTARTRRLAEVQIVTVEGPAAPSPDENDLGKASMPNAIVEHHLLIDRLVAALSFAKEFAGHRLLQDASPKIGLPLAMVPEHDRSVSSQIERAIGASEFHADRLVFHVQGFQCSEFPHHSEVLADLRRLGSGVSVESFIADGRHFEVLSNRHVNYINCNERLMKSVMQHDLAWSFAHGLVALAGQTGKTVVFGGVDTEDEFQAVSRMGDVHFHGQFTRSLLNLDVGEGARTPII